MTVAQVNHICFLQKLLSYLEHCGLQAVTATSVPTEGMGLTQLTNHCAGIPQLPAVPTTQWDRQGSLPLWDMNGALLQAVSNSMGINVTTGF